MKTITLQMTVTEACAEIRTKLHDTLLKGLGNTKEYGLFQPNILDPSKGVWLDQEKPFSYYVLENHVRMIYVIIFGQHRL